MRTTGLFGLVLVLGLGACRGGESAEPPMYVIDDMDWQPKIQGQEESAHWPDGRGNRPPLGGTVARGQLFEDEGLHLGQIDGSYLAKAPIEVDERVLARGQERFNIYCAPCHDRAGSGHGMVLQRAGGVFPQPPDLAGDRVLAFPDGQLFDVISNGVRNMPAYRTQIPAEDRWAIVTWVRVLQRSQHGAVDDVPADQRGSIEDAQ